MNAGNARNDIRMILDTLHLITILGGLLLSLLCLGRILSRLDWIGERLHDLAERFRDLRDDADNRRLDETIERAKQFPIDPDDIHIPTARQTYLRNSGSPDWRLHGDDDDAE